jgi:hypothetical protein
MTIRKVIIIKEILKIIRTILTNIFFFHDHKNKNDYQTAGIQYENKKNSYIKTWIHTYMHA